MKLSTTLAVGACLSWAAQAITLDPWSVDSIKNAARDIAFVMMRDYTGNQTGDNIGLLPEEYYWWSAGAMLGTMVEYWSYTGDTTYNSIVKEGLLSQTGPDGDFMPVSQSRAQGNDDQGFWALAAMTAVETNFEEPSADQPSWLDLAQTAFYNFVARWDTDTCGGGLRWQIFNYNIGYDYKNSLSNGVFFNLAARLAVHTQDDTYAEWATKIFEWQQSSGLMSSTYELFDGARAGKNCSEPSRVQWSYVNGVYLLGAATMYNYTDGQSVWRDHVVGLLSASNLFFEDDIMIEAACESTNSEPNTCSIDMYFYKGLLARWMARTTKLVPFTKYTIMPMLMPSAEAAAKQCDGSCGFSWTTSTNDGNHGVGQQMSALSVVQSLLVDEPPATTSQSDGSSNEETSSGSSSDSGAGGRTENSGSGSEDVNSAGRAMAIWWLMYGALGSVGAWLLT